MAHTTTDFTLLTTEEEFHELSRKLNDADFIAVDLEFDRFRYRYGFNLCLMQLFDGNTCYLLDPITDNADISPIFPVFEDPSILKIAFSFGEDLRLLHHLGCHPSTVYDLSIAASLLDYQQMSLANLLSETIQIDLPKSSQQSNWIKRPLSEKQLVYAANDVLHLPELYTELHTSSVDAGLTEWIRQENDHFFSFNYENEDHTPSLKEKDKGNLTEVEWKLFTNISEVVNKFARNINRPPFQVADKDVMRQLSERPDNIEIWKKSNRVHRKLKDESALNELIRAIRSAQEEAAVEGLSDVRKARSRMSSEEYKHYQETQQLISSFKKTLYKPIQKYLADKYGKNAQSFILNNRLIAELVCGNTDNLLPYKRHLFSQAAEKLGLEPQW